MTRFRSRRIMTWAAAVLGVAAGACSESLSFVAPEDPAAPLFEVESRNSAWTPYWAGFYVDGEGRVYEWNRSEARDASLADSVLTPEALARKYSANRKLVKTLGSGEALQHYQLVAAAAAEGLAELKGGCADAGIMKLSAWAYDAQDRRYHRILLHQRGDEATTRRSDAARTLWHWLDQVTGNEATGCDPYAG
jgi:hypothetical protein